MPGHGGAKNGKESHGESIVLDEILISGALSSNSAAELGKVDCTRNSPCIRMHTQPMYVVNIVDVSSVVANESVFMSLFAAIQANSDPNVLN